MKRTKIETAKRVVVKVGSSFLCANQGTLQEDRLSSLVKQIVELKKMGLQVALVSSGAIACGMDILKFKKRPRSLTELQVCAAVGQGRLYRLYERHFHRADYQTGQLLLTQDGLEHRSRYVNARHTLNGLFKLDIIPVINENDTVSTKEITFGDNDMLSAVVTQMAHADLLIMLSDVDGLYVKENNDVKVVNAVEKIENHFQQALFDTKKRQTVGGIKSKVLAAKMVMSSGIPMVLANGQESDILVRIMKGEPVGTYFHKGSKKRTAKKSWLAYSTKADGKILVDEGAQKVLCKGGKSLLSSGIVRLSGKFGKGATVDIQCESTKHIFARGLVNFDSRMIKKIAGKKSSEIQDIIGAKQPHEVIHCDSMVILDDMTEQG